MLEIVCWHHISVPNIFKQTIKLAVPWKTHFQLEFFQVFKNVKYMLSDPITLGFLFYNHPGSSAQTPTIKRASRELQSSGEVPGAGDGTGEPTGSHAALAPLLSAARAWEWPGLHFTLGADQVFGKNRMPATLWNVLAAMDLEYKISLFVSLFFFFFSWLVSPSSLLICLLSFRVQSLFWVCILNVRRRKSYPAWVQKRCMYIRRWVRYG